MLLKDEVIVLSTIRYKDKNLIVKAYSKTGGMQSFFTSVSTGKGKTKSRNNFQAFSLLELVYKKDSNSNLSRITESKNLELLLELRTNVGKNAIAFLLAEIYAKCIQEEEGNEELYYFLHNQVLTLNNTQSNFSNFHLYSLAQLTKQLGICPAYKNDFHFFDIKEGLFCDHRPAHLNYLDHESASLFQQFLMSSWEEAQRIKMNGTKRSEFLNELLKYYQYHVPSFQKPKSLDILEEVFQS